MQGLLAPAIRMMNKLTYAQKFGVISLTFFIPFLWLSYATINQSYQKVKSTKIEKNSIAVVVELFELEKVVSYYRDLLVVEILKPRSNLSDEVTKAEAAYKNKFAELKTKYEASDLGSDLLPRLDEWDKKLNLDHWLHIWFSVLQICSCKRLLL